METKRNVIVIVYERLESSGGEKLVSRAVREVCDQFWFSKEMVDLIFQLTKCWCRVKNLEGSIWMLFIRMKVKEQTFSANVKKIFSMREIKSIYLQEMYKSRKSQNLSLFTFKKIFLNFSF